MRFTATLATLLLGLAHTSLVAATYFTSPQSGDEISRIGGQEITWKFQPGGAARGTILLESIEPLTSNTRQTVVASNVDLTSQSLTFPDNLNVRKSSTNSYRLLMVNAADVTTIYAQVGPFTIDSFSGSGGTTTTTTRTTRSRAPTTTTTRATTRPSTTTTTEDQPTTTTTTAPTTTAPTTTTTTSTTTTTTTTLTQLATSPSSASSSTTSSTTTTPNVLTVYSYATAPSPSASASGTVGSAQQQNQSSGALSLKVGTGSIALIVTLASLLFV